MALRAGRFSQNARLQQVAQNNPSMKEGETGEAVGIVQQALIDLGYPMPITSNYGRSVADGIFGPETARVVTQFQTANALVRDGIVGRDTLGKLDELIVVQSASKDLQSRMFARTDFTLNTVKPEA
jgi:peptidoglycan hydrolase-like protein with peptidoglycan-binding domain